LSFSNNILPLILFWAVAAVVTKEKIMKIVNAHILKMFFIFGANEVEILGEILFEGCKLVLFSAVKGIHFIILND